MPPGKSSSNLQSVLARFEQTIEKNNVAGVASGMYLTKLASSSRDTGTSKVRTERSSHTRSKTSSKRPANDASNQPIPRNSNRSRDGSLRSDTDKRSVRSNEWGNKEEKEDWKEFTDYSNNAKFNASFNSLLGGGDDQSSISDMSQETFGFDDVTFDDPFNPNVGEEFNPFGLEEVASIPEAVEKKQRPLKEKRGIGRLGNRTTKSQRDMKAAKKIKEKLLGENADEATSDEGDDDVEISHSVQDGEDDDGGFSLTYVASRDGKVPRNSSTGLREASFHRRSNKPLDAASTSSRQKSSIVQESDSRPNSRGIIDSIRRSEDSSRQVKEKTSDLISGNSERDEIPTKSKNANDSRQRKGKESDYKQDPVFRKQDESSSVRKGKIDDSAHSRRTSPPQREKSNSRDNNKSNRLETESDHRRTYSPPPRGKLRSREGNKSSQLESEPGRSPSRSPPEREKLSSRVHYRSSRMESESAHSRTLNLPPREKFSSRDNNKTSRLESDSTHIGNIGLSEKQESSTHRRSKTYGMDGKSSHGRKFASTLDPNSAQSRFFGGDAKVKVRTKAVKTLEDSERKSAVNNDGLDLSDHSKQSFNSKVSATSKVSTSSLLSSNSKLSSSASRPISSARETYGASRKPQLVSRSTSSRNY
jgi:hypothetical protein